MKTLAAIPMLVRQHAEDAAFLFMQRGRAFHGHSWNDVQLGRTDQRIAANIAGLGAAGRTGLEIAAEYAQSVGGPGEVFALGATAFATGEAVDVSLAMGLATPAGRKGLSGAIAWTEAQVIGPQVRTWLESGEEGLRLLGLAALSHHRHDPGATLATYLADPSPEVRSRAARLSFELGRADLAERLADIADGDIWPLLALARFGKGAGPLYEYAAGTGHPQADLALDVALIAAPDQARERLGAMLRLPDTRALALSRTGVAGDRSITGWLWQQLDQEDDVEAVQFALFDLVWLDPDLCSDLSADPAKRPPTVDAWLKAHETDPPHLSLRRKRLDLLRAGFRDRAAPFPDWRRTRAYPAWS